MKESPFPVLLRDAGFLVIDKPPGAAISDRAEDAPDVVARMAAWLGARPFAVHRLDRGTSGALLLALAKGSAAELAAQFRAGEVRKTYLAAVAGDPGLRGSVERPLRADPDDPRRFLPDPEGRPALTRWRRARRFGAASLLVVRTDTGRMHQIRVHLASVGHPLLGDRPYGGPNRVPCFPAPGRLVPVPVPRLALHAARLVFRHPADGRCVRVRAPLPADLAGLIGALTRRTGT